MEDKKKDFEDALKLNDEVENELQQSEDDKVAKEIITGRKEIYLKGYGNVVFVRPGVDLVTEGDNVYAKFKTEHLKKGDLLTRAQLAAILKQPVKVDGVVVEKGEWTEEDDYKMENLPNEIDKELGSFKFYRQRLQEIEKQLEVEKTKKKIETLEREKKNVYDLAYKSYLNITKKKIELLELQQRYVLAFSTCLEERANFERVKIYAPKCIFKRDDDGNLIPIWKNEEEFLNDPNAVELIAIFGMFLRGADVSFFGDMPEEKMS